MKHRCCFCLHKRAQKDETTWHYKPVHFGTVICLIKQIFRFRNFEIQECEGVLNTLCTSSNEWPNYKLVTIEGCNHWTMDIQKSNFIQL